MKALHRPDLFCWSTFDESRNLDFHSYVVTRPAGTVVVDPLPIGPHDLAHLRSLGPVRWIVVTNSDHTRAAAALAAETGARTCGPAAEQATFPLRCARWLTEGDEVSDGIRVVALDGSKTPGELALIVDGSTLITGDLVRAHRAAALTCLPAAKLADRAAAVASIRRLAAIPGIEAVLVGDGWPVFERGGDHLRALAASLD